MVMTNILKDLNNGVVLSELAGYSDGKFCAIHGKNAALVMLGTYIIDNSDDIDYPAGFIFRPGYKKCGSYLAENISKAKESGAKVGISAVSINISDTVDFLNASQQAGADYVSLCAHSTMEMFIRNDVSSALLSRKNWEQLKKWARGILNGVQIPVIFKIGAFDNSDVYDAIELIKEEGIPIIHINVKSNREDSEGIKFLKKVNKENIFIIAGGSIKDLNGALRIMNAGANAVSIGSASIKNLDICGDIQKLLNIHLK
jgi:tRNA-dihydrouridine synthase